MTDPQIAPRIVDGEPYCTGAECPAWKTQTLEVPNTLGFKWTETRGHCTKGGTWPQAVCIPGLRAQRDERTAERDAARRELCDQYTEPKYRFKDETKKDKQREHAASRDWLYLYPATKPK